METAPFTGQCPFHLPQCPGQILYPATQEDVDILENSVRQYPNPRDCEGSTVIRLVRLSDPVTSPVARVMRNRQFGIRDNERWQLLGLGIFCASIVSSLGFWQLERMQWKKGGLVAVRGASEEVPFS